MCVNLAFHVHLKKRGQKTNQTRGDARVVAGCAPHLRSTTSSTLGRAQLQQTGQVLRVWPPWMEEAATGLRPGLKPASKTHTEQDTTLGSRTSCQGHVRLLRRRLASLCLVHFQFLAAVLAILGRMLLWDLSSPRPLHCGLVILSQK